MKEKFPKSCMLPIIESRAFVELGCSGGITSLRLRSFLRMAMMSCCSALAMASAAHAADAAPADQSAKVEEIVVTAQRMEQNIQSVPVAVTAFSSASIQRHGIADIDDVQFHVPNLNIRDEAGVGALSIGIRGISVSAENFSYDSAVGVYVNGVFVARGNDFNATFFDVDSVQVLRGPQGTLFGRDTPAGAVLVDTKRPGSVYGGYLDANVGGGGNGIGLGASRTFYRFEGAVDLPITPVLAVRIAAYHINDNGWAQSQVSGYRYYAKDDSGIRGTAVFTPSDSFKATLVVDYNHRKDGEPLLTPIAITGPFTAAYDQLYGGRAASNAIVNLVNQHNPFLSDSASNTQGIKSQTYSATLLMDYRLSDDWHVGAITGYRHIRNSLLDEYYPVPYDNGDTTDDIEQSQISQELIVDGKLLKDKFHVLGGLYYFRETGYEQNLLFGVIQSSLPSPPFPAPPFRDPLLLRGQDIDNTSAAGFINVSYEILPSLTATGGVRYSDEIKRLDLDSYFTVSGIPLAFGPQKFHQNVPVYDAKLTWQVTSDLLLYASYGTGYRAGGIGFRATNAIFQPETSDTYEVGGKWDFHILSMPARLNTALFDTSYRNFQVDVVLLNPVRQTIVNAGAATIRGAEFEFSVKPIRNLNVDASVGLLDAHYNSFIVNNVTLGGLINFTGNQLRDAPKESFSVSATYTVPSHVGDWIYTVDWAHSSSYEVDTEFQTHAPPPAQTGAYLQRPTNIVNARITLAKAFGSPWDVSIWGKNLTDQVRLAFSLDSSNIALASYGEPLSYGLELHTRF